MSLDTPGEVSWGNPQAKYLAYFYVLVFYQGDLGGIGNRSSLLHNFQLSVRKRRESEFPPTKGLNASARATIIKLTLSALYAIIVSAIRNRNIFNI